MLDPVSLSVAIVIVTVAVRLALHPLTRRAVRGERARLHLAPRLAALRRRYASDPVRLAEETMALHRAAGVSPFAGMMPVLAQVPVFIVLFQIIAREARGTVLADRLMTGEHLLVFLALTAGLAVIAWLTSRRTAMLMRLNGTQTGDGIVARLPKIMPYATLVSAAVLPMGLVLYLLTSTTWTLVENIVLRRGLLA
jgi:YidC/Oxa1 family membrane protein insertase